MGHSDRRPRRCESICRTYQRSTAPSAASPSQSIGAKKLLIAADTVWILRNDFGKKHRLDSGVGFHSPEVYEKTRLQLFERARREAQETL